MWNKAVLLVIGLVVGGVATYLWFDNVNQGSSGEQASAEREILYWVAPMDKNYRRDKPGKSPMGMDLVPVYADDVEDDESVVSIKPHVVQNLGVRTEVAEFGKLRREINTVGYIEYDEDAMSHVHTRAEGWVEKLGVKATGDSVSKGQVLFELYSPTLVNAQRELLNALKGSNRQLLAASRERLNALGMTTDEVAELERSGEVNQRIRNIAEMDGVVTQLGVREGTYVTPATHVLSFAKLSQVWIIAEVFERQTSWIELNQEVSFELDYLPGQIWKGEVDYIYPELDPTTRTLRVRIKFDNQKMVIRPNMFASVAIFSESTDAVVHIPREAVIRGGVVDRVVVALTETKFRSVPVVTGMESAGRIEVLEGIAEGDVVVVSGQFLIDSESNIDSALARLSDS